VQIADLVNVTGHGLTSEWVEGVWTTLVESLSKQLFGPPYAKLSILVEPLPKRLELPLLTARPRMESLFPVLLMEIPLLLFVPQVVLMAKRAMFSVPFTSVLVPVLTLVLVLVE
jgi:hypothetical protein